MNSYATIRDFIWFELVPVLGDFADDFDLEGIAWEVAEYDDREFVRGYVLAPEYHDPIALNQVIMRHDKTAR